MEVKSNVLIYTKMPYNLFEMVDDNWYNLSKIEESSSNLNCEGRLYEKNISNFIGVVFGFYSGMY